jgi:hypothetical protein
VCECKSWNEILSLQNIVIKTICILSNAFSPRRLTNTFTIYQHTSIMYKIISILAIVLPVITAAPYEVEESKVAEERQHFFNRMLPGTSVPPCDSINEVTGFELVDASSPYRPVILPFSPVIDLDDFPTCMLNIYATASSNTCGDAPVGCVKLTLASQVRREFAEPYALYGNTGRFIRSGKPALGAQTLTACTYTDTECTVGESGCVSVDVFINDCDGMSM